MDSRKKEVDTEFTEQYTLDPEAFKQLIADKIKRNAMFSSVKTEQRERQAKQLAE